MNETINKLKTLAFALSNAKQARLGGNIEMAQVHESLNEREVHRRLDADQADELLTEWEASLEDTPEAAWKLIKQVTKCCPRYVLLRKKF